MAYEQRRVCSYVLKEAFGHAVETLGTFLISNGPSTLHQISKNVNIEGNEIKRSLLVLIQHQLVSYTTPKPKQTVYAAEVATILGMLRYPKHIHAAQEIADETGKLIVEDILLYGQTPLSHCIRRVVQQLDKLDSSRRTKEESVRKIFEDLVDLRYIFKVKSHSFDNQSSHHPIPSSDRFIIPTLAIDELVGKKRQRPIDEGEEQEPSAKRSKKDEETQSGDISADEDIHWFINTDRFYIYYRHQAIVQAAGEKIDTTCAVIVKAIIKAIFKGTKEDTHLLDSPASPAVYPSQILDCLPKSVSLNKEGLESYLSVLIDEQFLTKTGDAGGGSYCINYKKCCEQMCQGVMESVVRERFGSKPLRLFKLLLQKEYLEQKQVSEMALIPNKESKEMLYSLLAENFVSLQEIPRSNDYTPSRTFYLFSVNRMVVARVMIEKCYQALGNLMSRRLHENHENERLLEKYAIWKKQAQVLGGAEGECPSDVEEAITPSERELAKKVTYSIDKIQLGELQVDNTAFIIEDYLRFLKDKSS